MRVNKYYNTDMLLRVIYRLNDRASTMNILYDQVDFDNALDSKGILNGDYAFSPMCEDDVIDAEGLRAVNGSLFIGGLGRVKLPKQVMYVRGGLVLFGYGDVELSLYKAPDYLLIADHVGNVDINCLEAGACSQISVGWSIARSKINICGIESTNLCEILFNKGDIRMPDLIKAQDIVITGNWTPINLGVRSAKNVQIELNEYGVYLRKLEEIENSLRINRNRRAEVMPMYPRGAYVDLSNLQKCKNIQCIKNDYINIRNLKDYETEFLLQNQHIYSDILKDQFCAKPTKHEIKERENAIKDYFAEMHK